MRAWCLALIVLGVACGPRPAETPKGAALAYEEALSESRLEDAYALLSADAKAEISFAEFKKLWENHVEEAKALRETTERAGDDPRVRATLTTKSGIELHMVLENGVWKLEESAVNLYIQSSPKEALASFVRAYENGRYDVLLRFVPESEKEGLDEAKLKEAFSGEQKAELEQLTQALKVALPTAPVELLGDRAVVSYGSASRVELLLEGGLWKIEDFK